MIDLPKPRAGMVLRYAYLWREEAERGEEEGEKARPAVVVVCIRQERGRLRVVVAPITHTQPNDPHAGVELPAITCRRIGLDHQRQWMIATEANAFSWPGPDLRHQPGKGDESVVIGYLPPKAYGQLRDRIIALGRAERFHVVQRSDARRSEEE